MSKIDPSDLLVPSRPYYYPFDFYDDYVYQNNIHEPSITKKGFTRQHKYRMRNSDTLKKEDIYRLAFLVGMNKAQIFQWMHIAGLCFSPISELDKLYLGYIGRSVLNEKHIVIYGNCSVVCFSYRFWDVYFRNY